jgi:hypothetical protein
LWLIETSHSAKKLRSRNSESARGGREGRAMDGRSVPAGQVGNPVGMARTP